MKKIIYLSICAVVTLILSASKTQAQYYITTHSPSSTLDTMCFGPNFTVNTNVYSATLSITTFFGDGTSAANPVFNGGSYGYATFTHPYSSAGAYTIKHVLYNGTSPVDSVTESYTYNYCNTFAIRAYNDINNNCMLDTATEAYSSLPMTVEVDSSGVPIDTVVTSSGFYYLTSATPGTVYTFKVLSITGGVAIICPLSGILTDTVKPIVNNYSVKAFAVNCTTASGLDIMEFVDSRAGRHHFGADLVVTNNFCTPQNVTLTIHFSPKYNYQYAYPAPASVSGTTVVWNLIGVSSMNPVHVSLGCEVPGAWLLAGDTARSDYSITPVTGDADPSNNYMIMVDTVSSSYDPNEKEVSPKGNILAGTKLTYTVHFENTGNDTAFNIHVMDTLSDNLDIRSLNVLTSTAPMNISILKSGTHNVAKFDFPNINLLDTTHHGKNTGMFMFTIKTKPGLPNGTTIFNKAGIYFDFNDVVMTNTVENIIGIPTGVSAMSNVAKVEIYPNPVNDELTINVDNGSYSKVSITNTIGQQVLIQELNGAKTQVNVRSLPAGIYFITLRGESGVKVQQFEKL